MGTIFTSGLSIELPWAVYLGLLLVASGIGFVSGVACAPRWQAWRLRSAGRSLRRLCDAAFAELELSLRLCRQLDGITGELLAPQQWSRLSELARQLQAAFQSLIDRHQPPATMAQPADFVVAWNRTSLDANTGLPDRIAFDDNLQRLLSDSTTHQQPSGVLLVHIDKADQLRRRFGVDAALALEQRLGLVLVKSCRDQDLVCRIAPGAFAVLLPCVSPLTGARLAEAMRTAVREHRFHVGETGPEVMVTASFGYAACQPNDSADLVLDRAGTALARSQSCGRNQLHLHDADRHLLCRVR